MCDDWDDSGKGQAPSSQYNTHVFTNRDRRQGNWNDDSQRGSQSRGSGRRDDNGGGGGGFRGGNRRFQNDEPSTLIKVPSRFVGRIIGRGGSKINELQSESGARINVTKDVDGDQTVIRLSGSSDAVAKAEDLIRDLTVDRNQYGGAP